MVCGSHGIEGDIVALQVTQHIAEIEWFDIAAAVDVVATCDIANCHIDVTWTDAELYEHGYRVYRSVDGGAFELLAELDPDTTTYEDAAIGEAVGCTFQYGIAAFIEDIESVRTDTDLEPC